MRAMTTIAVLVLSVCLAQQASAWLYGGWGYGLGLGYYGLGYGLGWGWPYYRYFRSTMSEGDITHRVQCRYVKDKSVISCTGVTGVVECDVVANFTGLGTEHKFEMYGLSCPNHEKVAHEFVHFNIYPRSVDNKFWYNSTFHVDNYDVSLALFHSPTFSYYGYRVPELTCFERFISLFKDASSDEVVTVNGVTPTFTVPLFGEILEVTTVEH